MRPNVILRSLLPLILSSGLFISCLYTGPDGELPSTSVLASLAGISSTASTTTSETDPTPTTDTTPTTPTSSTISRFVAVGASGIAMYSDDAGVTWTDSSPGGGQIEDIAFGNNVYVAVGAGGRILWSADAASWTEVTPAVTANTLNGVTFGGGRFVAVGNSGTALYSTDGNSWTVATTNLGTNKINKVAYGSGTFVAMGGLGDAHRSTDGDVWTSQVVAGTPTKGMEYLAFAAGRFIGASEDTGNNNHRTWWSTDAGVTWNLVEVTTQKTSVQGFATGISYGAGRWFTYEWKGFLSHSTDGTSRAAS